MNEGDCLMVSASTASQSPIDPRYPVECIGSVPCPNDPKSGLVVFSAWIVLCSVSKGAEGKALTINLSTRNL